MNPEFVYWEFLMQCWDSWVLVKHPGMIDGDDEMYVFVSTTKHGQCFCLPELEILMGLFVTGIFCLHEMWNLLTLYAHMPP